MWTETPALVWLCSSFTIHFVNELCQVTILRKDLEAWRDFCRLCSIAKRSRSLERLLSIMQFDFVATYTHDYDWIWMFLLLYSSFLMSKIFVNVDLEHDLFSLDSSLVRLKLAKLHG